MKKKLLILLLCVLLILAIAAPVFAETETPKPETVYTIVRGDRVTVVIPKSMADRFCDDGIRGLLESTLPERGGVTVLEIVYTDA